jgi:hypothetical protein
LFMGEEKGILIFAYILFGIGGFLLGFFLGIMGVIAFILIVIAYQLAKQNELLKGRNKRKKK